eukprot:6906834-Prymnesium_polylepis.1
MVCETGQRPAPGSTWFPRGPVGIVPEALGILTERVRKVPSTWSRDRAMVRGFARAAVGVRCSTRSGEWGWLIPAVFFGFSPRWRTVCGSGYRGLNPRCAAVPVPPLKR